MGGKVALRLALRREGAFWNAYVAPIGTMDGAFLIGSIAMAAVETNGPVKSGFMDLMKAVVEAGFEPGEVEGWNAPTRAPESERSGHG